MKVAKLVVVSIMTRVVVDENATDEDIIEAARPQLMANMKSDLHENVETIFDDLEVPFGTLDTDYTDLVK